MWCRSLNCISNYNRVVWFLSSSFKFACSRLRCFKCFECFDSFKKRTDRLDRNPLKGLVTTPCLETFASRLFASRCSRISSRDGELVVTWNAFWMLVGYMWLVKICEQLLRSVNARSYNLWLINTGNAAAELEIYFFTLPRDHQL